MYTVKLIKVGNHYYPNLKHNNPEELVLDPKFERMINLINTDEDYYPTVYFHEIQTIMPEEGLLKINEDDITRYLTTDDDFDLRVSVNDHDFKLSSKLYTLLEDNFNLELCKTLYKIEIW